MKNLKCIALSVFAATALVSCGDDDEGDVTGNDLSVNLYATSNTNGGLTAYKFEDDGDIETRSLFTGSTDTEGVFFDNSDDQATVVSRVSGRLFTYGNIDGADSGATITPVVSSATGISESPRDVAVSGNVYVVADNSDVDGDDTTDDGRLFVYTRDGADFTLRNTVTVDFAVWDIEFVGPNLYAVVDKTSDLAQFNNFAAANTTDATVIPSKRITIEGIVRTHGLGFDGDTMIITDIGSAMVDNDGGFHIVRDFEAKFNGVADGGTLAVANNQVRVSGSATFLGNPVSADYDQETETIYIAERANSGGRVLAFTEASAGGNVAPDVNVLLDGASAVFFSED